MKKQEQPHTPQAEQSPKRYWRSLFGWISDIFSSQEPRGFPIYVFPPVVLLKITLYGESLPPAAWLKIQDRIRQSVGNQYLGKVTQSQQPAPNGAIALFDYQTLGQRLYQAELRPTVTDCGQIEYGFHTVYIEAHSASLSS